jgi:nitrous oxide reductase accessory protein NosL
MLRPEARRWRWLLVALLAAGCRSSAGPPAIHAGTPCVTCGMEVRDLRFACERGLDRTWRVYDAIECLIRDTTGSVPASDAWLADYDTQSLRPADSVWVVRGDFPSPMGGGFAAFGERAAADSVAGMTSGRVDRLAAFLREHAGGAP